MWRPYEELNNLKDAFVNMYTICRNEQCTNTGMGKQQRDNAMFEYLELYVHVDIITDNHDLFSQLKTTFRHAFRTCNLKSVLWVDKDVFKPGFIVNYTVLHKTKTIVTNCSTRQQHTRTRLYCCCWFFFQKSIPHVTWFSSFQLFICLLKY